MRRAVAVTVDGSPPPHESVLLGTSRRGPVRRRVSLASALALCASGVHTVVCRRRLARPCRAGRQAAPPDLRCRDVRPEALRRPTTPPSPTCCAGHGAADLVTAPRRACWRPCCPSSSTRDRRARRAARARGAQQRPVAPAGVGEALVIVRGPDAYVSPSWYADQGRARPGRADLELHRRARVRRAGRARRPGLDRRPGAPADRQARGAAARRRGRSTTLPRRSSPASCARSSASSSRSAGSRRSGS